MSLEADARLKARNEKLIGLVRQLRGEIRQLASDKREVEECLAKARERGWDEMSREKHRGAA